MSKGSVGLGMATRSLSAPSLQKNKNGKSIFAYMLLSLILLIFGAIAPQLSNSFKHRLIERSAVINDIIAVPTDYILANVSKFQALLDVQKTNQQLAEENERLLEWFQTANRLDSENKALRDLLKMKEDDAVTFLSAKVISDAATQYSHTILVKSGEKDGLSKGQGVLSHEGLIGRVIETGQETSRVLLMSDVNSRIPVAIQGTHDRAILAGTNNGDPVLDHLPETHKVVAGQKVITSGHGGVFPYGVAVGETYVDNNGNMAVRPYADPNRANHVQIVDYGVPAGSATRATASAGSSVLR